MAAHCINDVATVGAEPLFLLDYVAASRIELDQVAELVDGLAEVCRSAGCALIGGETAEMPDVYRDGELDFAATCVGLVDRERLRRDTRRSGSLERAGTRTAAGHRDHRQPFVDQRLQVRPLARDQDADHACSILPISSPSPGSGTTAT